VIRVSHRIYPAGKHPSTTSWRTDQHHRRVSKRCKRGHAGQVCIQRKAAATQDHYWRTSDDPFLLHL